MIEGFSEVLSQEVAPFGIKVTIVEPGSFRTDWAGSSMTIHEIRPDYAPTVGAMVERRNQIFAQAPGDPARGAEVILQVARLERPPLRLLLGSDAVRIAAAKVQALKETDEQWKHLSLSTDFAATS